jgi:diaminopimelate epimerase
VVRVKVDRGKAELEPAKIPVTLEGDRIVDRAVDIDGEEYNITCVSMGNPHAVVFTELVDVMDLEKIGPRFEYNKIFPERVNTEFVKVIDDHTLKMRVWERGSGETMSCGTGTCAVTVAAVLNGYVARGRETEVRIRGGSLYDTWLDSGEVHMKGPAETVFEGEIRL